MAKSIWNGELSFGLVSIPISLISAEESKELKFHLLDSKTKSRVRYERINEDTGKKVNWEDIVKGWEYEKGSYVIVDEKAFEKASPDLFKTIDIEEFVDIHQIDTLYYSKPYYLQPESKNKKAYVLLREALKKANKVGVAKVIIRTKESLSLIIPHEHALVLYLIHFSDEIREEEEMRLPTDDIKAYKITTNELKMAQTLIEEMSNQWKPEKYHNEYKETMQKWLDKQSNKLKKSSKKGPKNLTKADDSVIDFISLLKDSMKHGAKRL